MAHKTLIGGTAYEITGGKALIDGTAYSIKSGKTLVGGTAYGINFAPSTAIITITGANNNSSDTRYADITINGTVYDAASVVASGGTVVLEIPVGTIIECYVNGCTFPSADGQVYINEESVYAAKIAIGTYSYEVIGNADIYIEEKNASSGIMSAWVGNIYITEE